MFLFNIILLGRYFKKFNTQSPILLQVLLVHHRRPGVLSSCASNIPSLGNNIKEEITASALQKLTGWTDGEIAKVFLQYPPLRESKVSDVIETYNLLKEECVGDAQIYRSPWLLMIERSDLNMKMCIIKQLDMSVNEDTIPLLSASVDNLKAIERLTTKRKLNFPAVLNNILFFHENLKIQMEELLRFIHQKHVYLVILKQSKLYSVMNILKSFGVDPEYIRGDLWIFRHNEETMVKRLKQIKAINFPVKPWMLRCSEHTFSILIAKRKEILEVLGQHKDNIDYLSYRLNRRRDYVQNCCIKNPRLPNVHPRKLKEILDFLLERNFTAEEICSAPRIFNFSLQTVERRFKDFDKIRYRPVSLQILCCNNKTHKEHLQKLE